MVKWPSQDETRYREREESRLGRLFNECIRYGYTRNTYANKVVVQKRLSDSLVLVKELFDNLFTPQGQWSLRPQEDKTIFYFEYEADAVEMVFRIDHSSLTR